MKNQSASEFERWPAAWTAVSLRDDEFQRFADLISEAAGVHLAPIKKSLVQGRLSARLRALGCTDFLSYHNILQQDHAERQRAIDLLTTHETSFFRHSSHFEALAEMARRSDSAEFRVWSAACSSGEEAYSIAMILAEHCRGAWSVVATDISQGILAQAARGEFRIEQKQQVPPALLKRYCLRGVDQRAHLMKISRQLRERVRFMQASVLAPPPFGELCDAVFLRNVIIYFPESNKQRALQIAISRLKRGGRLFLGGSESLRPQQPGMRMVQPAVYSKQ